MLYIAATDIQPYFSDNEGMQMLPLYVGCGLRDKCNATLTYSTKITKLAPPPFDTNCRDYRESGSTSRDHCFNQCLNDFTIRHGMILETSLIHRDEYGNSSLVVIPWFFKTMTINGTKLTKEDVVRELEKLRDKRKDDNRQLRKFLSIYVKKDIPADYIRKLANMFPSYEDHWSRCKKTCNQADCYKESIMPQVLSVYSYGQSAKKSGSSLLSYSVYASMDPVMTITSSAKMNLLDFIIYIFNCLNFWFGLCAVQLAHLKINVRRETKVKAINVNQAASSNIRKRHSM